jgi:sporulation protein YlmC with PRC-barrel domain
MENWPKNRLRAYMPMGDLEGKRDFNFCDIRGFQILNTTGHKVGTVKDVFVDPNTLQPCFAFLGYQKFLNFNVKSFLVPWDELIIGQDYVQTRWTEHELLPETRAEQERNLAGHGGGTAANSDTASDDELASISAGTISSLP